MLELLEERAAPATHVWSGAFSNLMSDDRNWSSGGHPVTGEGGAIVLVFPNTAKQFNVTDDLLSLQVDQIQFTGAASNYFLSGAAGGVTLHLTGSTASGPNIDDQVGGDTFSATNLTLALDATAQIRAAAGTLTIASAITGPGGLTKLGVGRLILQGSGSYGGAVNINEGVLQVRNDTALGKDPGGATTTTTLGPGNEEVQTLTISGAASDTFQLTFNGSTTPMLHVGSATLASDIQNALNALPSVASVGGSVAVTQSGNVYTVTFGGSFVGFNQPQLTSTGANAADVVVNTKVDGDGAALEIAGGVNIANEHLVLGGSGNAGGNTRFGDAPLTVLSGANTWAGPVTLANAITVDVKPGASIALNGTVDDAPNTSASGSDLTLTELGTLILAGANTYRGTTFVNEGVLNVRNNQALGGTGVAEVQTLTLSGSTTGTFTLTFNGQITGPLPANATALQVQQALNALSTIGGVGGKVTVTKSGNVYTVTFGGTLFGFQQPPIILVGSGGTVVTAAIVTDGAGGTVVANGASLQLQGDVTIAGEPLILQGAGRAGAGGLGLESVLGANTFGGPVFLVGDPVNNKVAVGVDAGALTVSGAVQDLVPGSDPGLDKLGAGTLTLSGANTYGGVTDIQAGVLVAANASALGGAGPTAGTTVESGAALWLQSDLQLEPLTLNGDGLAVGGHNTGALRSISGANTVTGTITLNTDATIGVDPGSTLTVGSKTGLLGTGTITDNGQNKQLTKELTGTLVLQSANTYGGKTEIDQGVLQVQNSQALGGTAGGTEVLDGAQLQLQTPLAGQPVVVSGESLTLSGTGISGGGALLDAGGNNTWQGPITLAGVPGFSPPTNPPADVAIGVANAGDTLTVDGGIGQSGGTFGLDKVGPGRLILTRGNSYGGVTTVSAGELRIQNGGALGITSNGTLVQSGAALELDGDPTGAGASITVSGEALTLGTGAVSGAGAGALQNVSGNNTWGGSITLQTNTSIGVSANTTLSVTGVLQDPSPNPVLAASLTKVGSGTLVFPNANTYTGQTNVNGGVLNIRNASALSGSSTVVNNGGTLQVQGGINVGNEPLTLNGAGFNNAGALENVAGSSNTWTSLVTLGSNASIGVDGPADTLKIAYKIDDGGKGFGVTEIGPGSLEYTGITDNTYSGLTQVKQGTLLLAMTPVPFAEVQTVTVFGNSGTFNLAFNGQTTDNLAWNVPASGGISPTASMQNALNDLSSIQALGNGGVTVTKSGNFYIVFFPAADGHQPQMTGANASGNADPVVGTQTPGTPQAFSGNLTIGDNVSGNAVARWLGNNTVPDTSTVTVNSDGVLDLNGKSDTIGSLVIVDGQATTGAGLIGQLTVGSLNMTGGTFTAATAGSALVLAGDVTATSDAATGTAIISGKGQVSLGGATRTFTVNRGSKPVDLDVGTVITSVAGEGLTKDGAGRLELDAANTYGGLTTVNSGDLEVDGTVGNVALAGGSLSGVGTVGTIDGQPPVGAPAVGTIDPGDNQGAPAIGILHSQTVTLGTNATVHVDFRHSGGGTAPITGVPGADNDQLNVTGDVFLNGAALSGVVDPSVVLSDTFTIIQTTGGTVHGTFAAFDHVFLNGLKFLIDYSDPTKVVLQRVKADARVSVVSSVNPAVYGQPVLYTATVTPVDGDAPAVPTSDTVTFTFDGVSYPAVNVNAMGQAVFDPQAATGGPLSVTTPSTLHTLHVAFSGDATEFNASQTDLSPAQTVNKAHTSVAVTGVHLNTATGKVTFTALVTVASPGAGTPTGTVTFTDKNSTFTIGSPNLIGGVATVTVDLSSLPLSPHDVRATFSGDPNFNGSGPSAPFTFGDLKVLTVAPAAPVTPPAKLSQITITFNRAVSPGSFDTTDLTLTDPNHNHLALQNLVDANHGTDTIWTVDLVTPQTAPGDYTLTVGPHIADVANFEMDQNGNGINGEAGDQFSSTFVLQAGPITYSGSGQLRLELDATGANLQFFVNNVLQDSRSLASITAFMVNGAATADTLTLDYTNGVFLKPITFNGGGGDALQLKGGTLTSLTYLATAPHGGALVLNGDAANAIRFLNLAPVVVASTVGTTMVTIADNNPHTATFTAGPGAGNNTVTFDGGLESMTFTNPTAALVVNGNSAGDAFTFSSQDAAFTARTIAVHGGQGNDTLTLDAAAEAIGTAPRAVFFVQGARTVAYSMVDVIHLNNAATVQAIAGPATAERSTAFAGLTPQERAVQALYLDELGRAGSKPELDGWVNLFPAGAMIVPAQIAAGVAHSPEARDHLVKSWYLSFLGRAAAPGEDQGWVNLLLAGQTEEQVLGQILGSAEFYARAQTLAAAGTPDQRFVQALYQVLLNRTPAAAEVDGWANALPNLSRQGAALDFLQSQEFRTDDFEGYYNALLHRPSDAVGLNSWFMSNLDVSAVRIGFEAGAEFFVDG
jgi:autotransporter-associated beta strand protein